MSRDFLLSILIPTLGSRGALFERLNEDLNEQVEEADAGEDVEILVLRDDGAESVGAKRNQLIDMAHGRFIVFVDDDDRVSADYVRQILTAIHENPAADCISCAGEISFRGRHQRRLVHSVDHRDWMEKDGRYLRPPCHITPMRRDIAMRYRFAEVDYSEDMDWAMRISRDGALRREVIVDRVLYYYDSRRHYAWQWLLDHTQPLRHALGLRLVNRLALRKRLSARFRDSGQ